MADVKKVTKRERFMELKEIVGANEDLQKFLDHEIELLDNKKSKSGTTKTQKENEVIKAQIVESLVRVGRSVTISELQAEDSEMAKFSNQKLSALLKQMVEVDKTATKVVDKKKSYFSAVAD